MIRRISILKVQWKLPAVPSTELFLNRYAEIYAYLFFFFRFGPEITGKEVKKETEKNLALST